MMMQSRQTATNSENNYKPTKAEQALLDVLLNPENRMKSVADVCKIAKIDRTTYYRAFAKPDFVEIYRQSAIDLVKQNVAPVLNTFIREAQRGSFQHGKILLEMAGVYVENAKVEHSGQINTNVDKLDAILEQLKK
jgi:hypothetical protein